MPARKQLPHKLIQTASKPEGEVLDWLSRPSGLAEAVCEIGGAPLVLDDWQREYVDGDERFVIVNKSRQTGFSLACGVRAWARCYLEPHNSYTGVFVSYNLGDAREKIRYVNMLDEYMPEADRLRRVVDTKTEIEFGNGNRIVTMFMPRGKGPTDLMLDELAHITDAGLVYQAGVPMISRGGGIRVGSSPLARTGIFADIWAGADGKFGQFKRVMVPWWVSRAMCRDVGGATREAPDMPTAERVERFGSEAIREIFDNYFLEDFQTEYECSWSDESTSFLSWELIEACSPTFEPPQQIANIGLIDTLKGDLYAGMDVGRRINATEFVVGERMGNSRIEDRLLHTMQNKPLPEQEAFAVKLLQCERVRRFTVDYTGLGLQMGDSLSARFGSRVKLVAMSGVSKPQVAGNMRAMMERDLYRFYPDREVRRQLHSVKKVITAGGNIIYDADRNEKHHADKFWARALMLFGAADADGAGRPAFMRIRMRASDD